MKRRRGPGFGNENIRAMPMMVDPGGVICGVVQAMTIERLAAGHEKIARQQKMDRAPPAMAAGPARGNLPDRPVIGTLFGNRIAMPRGRLHSGRGAGGAWFGVMASQTGFLAQNGWFA